MMFTCYLLLYDYSYGEINQTHMLSVSCFLFYSKLCIDGSLKDCATFQSLLF